MKAQLDFLEQQHHNFIRLWRWEQFQSQAAGGDFHRRVGDGFRALAMECGDSWVVVDGTLGPDDVEKLVWSAVVERLPDLANL